MSQDDDPKYSSDKILSFCPTISIPSDEPAVVPAPDFGPSQEARSFEQEVALASTSNPFPSSAPTLSNDDAIQNMINSTFPDLNFPTISEQHPNQNFQSTENNSNNLVACPQNQNSHCHLQNENNFGFPQSVYFIRIFSNNSVKMENIFLKKVYTDSSNNDNVTHYHFVETEEEAKIQPGESSIEENCHNLSKSVQPTFVASLYSGVNKMSHPITIQSSESFEMGGQKFVSFTYEFASYKSKLSDAPSSSSISTYSPSYSTVSVQVDACSSSTITNTKDNHVTPQPVGAATTSTSTNHDEGVKQLLKALQLVKTIEEYKSFEETYLNTESNWKSPLILRLSVLGGNSLTKCVNTILKFLMNNSVRCLFNWKGRGNKSSFEKTQLKSIVIDAVRASFKDATDLQLKDAIQTWLKNASKSVESTVSEVYKS